MESVQGSLPHSEVLPSSHPYVRPFPTLPFDCVANPLSRLHMACMPIQLDIPQKTHIQQHIRRSKPHILCVIPPTRRYHLPGLTAVLEVKHGIRITETAPDYALMVDANFTIGSFVQCVSKPSYRIRSSLMCIYRGSPMFLSLLATTILIQRVRALYRKDRWGMLYYPSLRQPNC